MKKENMNSVLGVSIAASLALALAATEAFAQSYPAKPVRFIVPFAPGGGADLVARLVATPLSESLGQQVVVDSRGGASGIIGTEMAAKSAPDGYTMVLTSTNLAAGVSLYRKLPFDLQKDFSPVILLAKTPSILAVHPSLPVKTVQELIALAKSAPGKINYAGGVGTTLQLNAELFKSMAKIDLVHVPYNGTGPAVIGALSGEAPVILAPTLALLPHVKSGRLRALAITSIQRSAAVPDLPTVAESGFLDSTARSGTEFRCRRERPKRSSRASTANALRLCAGRSLSRVSSRTRRFQWALPRRNSEVF